MTKLNYYGLLLGLAGLLFAGPTIAADPVVDIASRPATRPAPNPDISGVDHKLWDYLLKRYLKKGLVDYHGLGEDELFRIYLQQLSKARPEKLSADSDRLALLCNAYNALVVSGVIRHRITERVTDFKLKGVQFFDVAEYRLAGKMVSLNHIEHKMIRARHKDPRVHMALVCAAQSCPSLRVEAYTGRRLDKQLEEQARLFANNPQHVGYDTKNKTLHLNPILKWFGRDFDSAGGYLKFLVKRANDARLKNALQQAAAGKVKIVFSKYDWSLNKQKAPPKSKGPLRGQ
ncbi:MAG: DUF547 domain-containing protein [Planctomycetota bacterium]|jgi:hypothetical protein